MCTETQQLFPQTYPASELASAGGGATTSLFSSPSGPTPLGGVLPSLGLFLNASGLHLGERRMLIQVVVLYIGIGTISWLGGPGIFLSHHAHKLLLTHISTLISEPWNSVYHRHRKIKFWPPGPPTPTSMVYWVSRLTERHMHVHTLERRDQTYSSDDLSSFKTHWRAHVQLHAKNIYYAAQITYLFWGRGEEPIHLIGGCLL